MKEMVTAVVDSRAFQTVTFQANRKFFFAICVLTAGTFLCANEKMSAESWSYFALGLAGLYITGNVGQKWVEKKYAVPTSTTTSAQ